MLFTEPAFLFLFLPGLLCLYYSTPRRYQNLLLTAASMCFYALGEWRFVGWLLSSIFLDYALALVLNHTRGTPWARGWLLVAITCDLALLVVFKYADFLVTNLNWLGAGLNLPSLPLPSLRLPLGISFFTFHRISYLVDVYRGEAQVRKNPLDLLLYILLFPQLIAGPIIRYHDIAQELSQRRMDRADLAMGIRRFIVGLGKKMLIANTAASAADAMFGVPGSHLTAPVAWLGALAYTVQIYFDFSGYSDMAIGLARMFGFHLLENFDHPYTASSVTEFWQRWHISLSRWFRDYLYIPLGGNRRGQLQTYRNLIVVFFLCGLWHGASWSFVVWGCYHGAFLVAERLPAARFLERVPKFVCHVYALIAVIVGWVFFRADTFGDAWSFLRAMAGFGAGSHSSTWLGAYLNSPFILIMVVAVFASAPLPRIFAGVLASARRQEPVHFPRLELVHWAGDAGLVLVLLLSILEAAAGTYNPFIYFRF